MRSRTKGNTRRSKQYFRKSCKNKNTKRRFRRNTRKIQKGG